MDELEVSACPSSFTQGGFWPPQPANTEEGAPMPCIQSMSIHARCAPFPSDPKCLRPRPAAAPNQRAIVPTDRPLPASHAHLGQRGGKPIQGLRPAPSRPREYARVRGLDQGQPQHLRGGALQFPPDTTVIKSALKACCVAPKSDAPRRRAGIQPISGSRTVYGRACRRSQSH